MAVKTASGLGVTTPSNRDSIATGKKGVVVNVGVSETDGVKVWLGTGDRVGVNVIVGVIVIVGVNVTVGDGGK